MVSVGDIVIVSGIPTGQPGDHPAIVTAVQTSQTIDATVFPNGSSIVYHVAYIPHQSLSMASPLMWRHKVEDPS